MGGREERPAEVAPYLHPERPGTVPGPEVCRSAAIADFTKLLTPLVTRQSFRFALCNTFKILQVGTLVYHLA